MVEINLLLKIKMIRRRCLHKCGKTQLTFCDTALVATSHSRFIGSGDTGLIGDGLEEAFLSVAKVIDSPTLINHMTVVVKRPSMSFDSIVFDLIRIPSPNGKVNLTGNSLITSLVVPGTTVSSPDSAFSQSQSFPVTVLNEGDLVAVRVEPTGISRPSFYAAATIS